MSLRYFPITGQLVLRDKTVSGDPITFDTDDENLCVHPSDVKTGSQVVPARTASSSGVNGTQTVVDVNEDYFIASLQVPGARVVRGLMRTTWASNPEPVDNLWRQASGSHVDIYDGVSSTQVPQDDRSGFQRVASLGFYTFWVNQLQHLVLNERLVLRARDSGNPPTNYNRARQQCTVSYRLLVGFFASAEFDPPPGVAVRSGAFLSGGGPSYTRTLNVGYEFSGRRVVAVIYAAVSGGPGRVPSTVTIGGVSATIHGSVAGASANGASVAICSAVVATGTSLDVVATYSSGVTYYACEVYILAGHTNSTPTIVSNTASAATSVSASATVGSQSVAIAACMNEGTNPFTTVAWTNAEYQPTGANPNLGASAIISPGAGTQTVTCTWPNSNDYALLIAIWS